MVTCRRPIQTEQQWSLDSQVIVQRRGSIYVHGDNRKIRTGGFKTDSCNGVGRVASHNRITFISLQTFN